MKVIKLEETKRGAHRQYMVGIPDCVKTDDEFVAMFAQHGRRITSMANRAGIGWVPSDDRVGYFAVMEEDLEGVPDVNLERVGKSMAQMTDENIADEEMDMAGGGS